jgi:transposase
MYLAKQKEVSPMVRKKFSIIKFVKKAYKAIKIFPKYLTKFSKKTFTTGQMIVLRTLKEVLNKSYDSLVDFLEDFTQIGEIIKLNRIPHPTTILKYSRRIGIRRINSLIDKTSTSSKKQIIAIDATGFEDHNASKHYCKTVNIRYTKRKYVKLSIAIDTQTQLICSQKSRIAPANDNKDFIPLLKRIKERTIKMVCADKGYDSKKNRFFVFKNLNAKPNIPKRKTTGQNYLTKMYDDKTYHQRSKSETVFSVIKKLFGSWVRATRIMMQRIEISYKCLAYNLRRQVISSEELTNRGCQ